MIALLVAAACAFVCLADALPSIPSSNTNSTSPDSHSPQLARRQYFDGGFGSYDYYSQIEFRDFENTRHVTWIEWWKPRVSAVFAGPIKGKRETAHSGFKKVHWHQGWSASAEARKGPLKALFKWEHTLDDIEEKSWSATESVKVDVEDGRRAYIYFNTRIEEINGYNHFDECFYRQVGFAKQKLSCRHHHSEYVDVRKPVLRADNEVDGEYGMQYCEGEYASQC